MEPHHSASHVATEHLCKSCFNLDTKALLDALDDEDETEDIDVTMDQKELTAKLWQTGRRIAKSAGDGCQHCLLLLRVAKHFGAREDTLSGKGKICIRFSLSGGSLEISFTGLGSPPSFIQLFRGSFAELGISKGNAPDSVDEKVHITPKAASILPLPNKHTDHFSESSIRFIKSCLDTCQEEHSLCRQDAPPSLPTRLLDVGTHEDDMVRLVETDCMAPAPYVTLSYCWGNVIALRTTSDTIDGIRDGVKMAGLPQTYIDAVNVCRALGVHYLWIDALCIIQDSREDWERESARMSAIYAGSLLTVAAASSSSAAEGFIRRGTAPALYDADQFYEDQTGIRARRIDESGHHWRWYDEALDRIPQEPWSRRGWTLQEQLISTRILTFMPSEMQWTCKAQARCECRSRLNRGRQFGGGEHQHLSQLAGPHEALLFWHKVVENYSNRLLTKREDRLPAVSGAAAVVARKTNSEYAAGLWTEFIDHELLWRRASDIDCTVVPGGGYVAPTWSWASVDGEVDYYCFRNSKAPYARSAVVEEVKTKSSPHAPFGRVEGGHLTIHGPVVPVLIRRIAPDGWVKARFGSLTLEFRADSALEQVSISSEDGSTIHTVSRYATQIPSREDGEKESPLLGRWDPGLLCWAIRMGTYVDRQATGHRDVELMVLGRSKAKPHHHIRIGLATYREEPGDTKCAEMYRVEETRSLTVI